MKHIKTLDEYLFEKKYKVSWKDSDAPDAEGKFKELGIRDLASWLIKTRKKDLKRISGSLSQQIVFNRGKNPKYAEKMEKTREEVYRQLGRKDLLENINEDHVFWPPEVKKLVLDNIVAIPEAKIWSTKHHVGADNTWDSIVEQAKAFGDGWRIPSNDEMVAISKANLTEPDVNYWTITEPRIKRPYADSNGRPYKYPKSEDSDAFHFCERESDKRYWFTSSDKSSRFFAFYVKDMTPTEIHAHRGHKLKRFGV